MIFQTNINDIEFEGVRRTIKILRLDDLVVNAKIQRSMNKKKVKDIKDNFCKYLMNPCKVSERDGIYYIFDGQHTVVGARQSGKIDDIECVVYQGLSEIDEARLFNLFNRDDNPVKPSDEHKIHLVAEEKVPSDIQDSMDKVNLVFTNSPRNGNHSSAVKAIYEIYNSYGKKRLEDVLFLIRKTWADDRDAWKSDIIKAVNLILGSNHKRLDIVKFANDLGPLRANTIIKNAKAREDEPKFKCAREILAIYNKGLKAKDKLKV